MRLGNGLIIVLAAFFVLALAFPALAGKDSRVALVIGNSAYKEKPLKNPANDARDMARALQRLGFDVQLMTDASLREMEEGIRQFGEKLKRGGVGLFYYAGHGIQVQGVNFLVPVGARIASESEAKFEAVDAGRVLGKMEDAGNELNIVILDACRNNPFARSFRSVDQGLARMDAPTGSIVAYATAPNAVASDGRGTNGMYTKYLLANIGTPGITIEEVFKRVRISVMDESAKKQVPWESSSIAGYFYMAGQPDAIPARMPAVQGGDDQRRQEQKLKEYIAGLEAEKRQVEQERADLERRRKDLDAEAAKKLKEAQAPREQRLNEQLVVLESERRKLEQERTELARARIEAERATQAQIQAQKEAQRQQELLAAQRAKAAQDAKAASVGPLASLPPQPAVPALPQPSVQPLPQPAAPAKSAPPKPRYDDRASVLQRLSGLWRLETDGGWRFPLLSLKPGEDTLYGSLVSDNGQVSRMNLSGLSMEDGVLHIRLSLPGAPERRLVVDDIRRWRAILRGGAPARPDRVIECTGNLTVAGGSGDIPITCMRVDDEAINTGFVRQENGRMTRASLSRRW